MKKVVLLVLVVLLIWALVRQGEVVSYRGVLPRVTETWGHAPTSNAGGEEPVPGGKRERELPGNDTNTGASGATGDNAAKGRP
jgi:hypothetical protein